MESMIADGYEDAARLYDHHATYVILPHLIGSEHVSAFLRTNGGNREAFDSHRRKHLRSIGQAVHNHSGIPFAALSVSAISSRMTEKRVAELATMLKNETRLIEKQLATGGGDMR